MQLVLSEYEKKNGVIIEISPDTYKYKYRIVDGKRVAICTHNDCLNQRFGITERCKKHSKKINIEDVKIITKNSFFTNINILKLICFFILSVIYN